MGRLRHRANRLARLQTQADRGAVHRQIQGTRRDTRQQVSSLASEGRALTANIAGARHDLMNVPGLKGRDQRIALEQLAQMRGETAAGIAYQQSAAQKAGAQAIGDLRSQLVDLAGQKNATATQILMDLRQKQADAATSSAKNGMTPYQAKEAKTRKQNALSLARQGLAALTDPETRARLEAQAAAAAKESGTPAVPIPPAPRTPAQWREFADQLYAHNSTHISHADAAWAVKQLRLRHDPAFAVRYGVNQALRGVHPGAIAAAVTRR